MSGQPPKAGRNGDAYIWDPDPPVRQGGDPADGGGGDEPKLTLSDEQKKESGGLISAALKSEGSWLVAKAVEGAIKDLKSSAGGDTGALASTAPTLRASLNGSELRNPAITRARCFKDNHFLPGGMFVDLTKGRFADFI